MADRQYGSEVQPNGPLQNMEEIDLIAGSTGGDRDSAPGTFTGGMGGSGLGGTASGEEPAGPRVP